MDEIEIKEESDATETKYAPADDIEYPEDRKVVPGEEVDENYSPAQNSDEDQDEDEPVDDDDDDFDEETSKYNIIYYHFTM